MFGPKEKTAIFIDASNLSYMMKHLQAKIDFLKFKSFFAKRYSIAYLGYYTAVEEDGNGHQWLRRQLDFLSHNGFTVVEKPLQYITTTEGRLKKKGNMDIELTLDVMEIHLRMDRVHIVSGDSDLCALVDRVQRRGVPITVVGALESGVVSQLLLKTATEFLELANMLPHIQHLE